MDAVEDPPLTPNGSTAIAAGAMTGDCGVRGPRAGPAPAALTKAVVVLTDGMDNTAFEPGRQQVLLHPRGTPAMDPANPDNLIPTQPFVPPPDVKIYAVGLGTGEDIELDSSRSCRAAPAATSAWWIPTQPGTTYQLMKFYTQIYMDLFDTSVDHATRSRDHPGRHARLRIRRAAGDVSAHRRDLRHRRLAAAVLARDSRRRNRRRMFVRRGLPAPQRIHRDHSLPGFRPAVGRPRAVCRAVEARGHP